nr:uncharacterized protein LOC111418565 [Onthophagus taurus]
MNELPIETCAVVSSVFGAILAQRINRLAKSKEKRKKRRWWVRKWILQRKSGTHNLVDRELRSNYTEDFKNLLRMSEAEFDYLLERVSPLISKSDTNMRQAVNAKTKLTVTLRYLATGDSFKSLEFLFRVPKNTISKFIPETCEAIHKTLREFIQVPATSDEWKNVESGFRQRWNFPGCVGALDGKHIVIRAPTATGSDYYNYKNSFSIVLMALADSDYCFLKRDIRKLVAEETKEKYLTGGGPAIKEAHDAEKDLVFSIMNKKTVYGHANTFDSDADPQPLGSQSIDIVEFLDDDVFGDKQDQNENIPPMENESRNSNWNHASAASLATPMSSTLKRKAHMNTPRRRPATVVRALNSSDIAVQ